MNYRDFTRAASVILLLTIASVTSGAGCTSAGGHTADGNGERTGEGALIDQGSPAAGTEGKPHAAGDALGGNTTTADPLAAAARERGEGSINPALIVQRGDFDVIALGEEVSPEIRRDVRSVLAREHGSAALGWTVQEEDSLQYVYAVPYVAGERRQAISDEIDAILATATVSCNWLYRHYFWTGSVFKICGSFGSHGYSNLANYGFDNQISSYYIDSVGCAVELYDGLKYSSFLIELDWDLGIFGGAYNDKTTSVWGWYP